MNHKPPQTSHLWPSIATTTLSQTICKQIFLSGFSCIGQIVEWRFGSERKKTEMCQIYKVYFCLESVIGNNCCFINKKLRSLSLVSYSLSDVYKKLLHIIPIAAYNISVALIRIFFLSVSLPTLPPLNRTCHSHLSKALFLSCIIISIERMKHYAKSI